MSTLRTIGVTEFLGQAIDDINFNFGTVLQVAQSLRGTDNNTGLCTPILLDMGATNQRWTLPADVVGDFVVFDHGMILRVDQYTISNGEVVLNYVPSGVPAYAITVAWCVTRGGILPPVSLVQDPMGPQYWKLPRGFGVNVLVFDHGRMLRRDQYQIDGDVVRLLYTPSPTYDIAASWGAGSAGIVAPVKLEQFFGPMSLDTIHYALPSDHGESVLVLDHGFILDAQDYTIDFDQLLVTLNYTPAEPLDVAVTWGFSMDGAFVEDTVISPAPDGIEDTFYLPTDPQPASLWLRARLSSGNVTYYTIGVDYQLVGRKIVFEVGSIPPAGSALLASFATSILFNPILADNPEIGTGNHSVTFTRGVELDIDTLTEHVEYNPDRSIAEVQYKDGATVIKRILYNYLPDGRVDTVVQQAAGRTVTRTYVYDGNNDVLDITQSVS